jgi:multiple sugar transport system permease protein
MGAVMLYPVLWMLASSFKPVEIIFSDVSLWPRSFTIESYIEGWTALPVSFGTFFLNSIVVSTGAVVGTLMSCSMAAYAFARLNFRFKQIYFATMLGTIMLPQHAVVVPQYILFLELGWLNTFLPLIVPHFLGTGAFFIFLMVQFMRGIPRDLDDAAKIDGAGPFQIYWQIMLPLMKPALVTSAIFIFIWTWDEFFLPLLYITDVGSYTVPLALRLFLDSTGESSWGMLFAMSILSLVPIFVVFLLFQRLLVEGISTSGLKG